jgi:hypothetical protein
MAKGMQTWCMVSSAIWRKIRYLTSKHSVLGINQTIDNSKFVGALDDVEKLIGFISIFDSLAGSSRRGPTMMDSGY